MPSGWRNIPASYRFIFFSTISAVADQRQYDYDDDWIEIKGVLFDNKPLAPLTISALDFSEMYEGLNEKHREETDTEPFGWYIDETTGKLCLIDIPNSAGTDNITVLHTVGPTVLTAVATNDTVELLNGHGQLKPFHPALVSFAIADLEGEDGNDGKAAHFKNKGNQKMLKLKRKIKYPRITLPTMQNMSGSAQMITKRYWSGGVS